MIFNKAFIKFDTNINFRFVKTKYDIYKTPGRASRAFFDVKTRIDCPCPGWYNMIDFYL